MSLMALILVDLWGGVAYMYIYIYIRTYEYIHIDMCAGVCETMRINFDVFLTRTRTAHPFRKLDLGWVC